ncbi:diaminopimelate epimerase, partial [Candidatus Hakubella thermalkaliphila]
ERGVGETLACGTGACAAAVASARSNFADRKVVVHLPGGDLEVDWQEDGYVYLTGPVVEIYQGMVLEEWLLQQYEED